MRVRLSDTDNSQVAPSLKCRVPSQLAIQIVEGVCVELHMSAFAKIEVGVCWGLPPRNAEEPARVSAIDSRADERGK
jgi:hypothetical protein